MGRRWDRPALVFYSFCTVSGYHMACHVVGILYKPGRGLFCGFKSKAGRGLKEEGMFLVTKSFHLSAEAGKRLGICQV